MIDKLDFLKRYNDYSCIEKNNLNIKELYHYTKSVDAVKGIAGGCFWATDIQDFNQKDGDTNEGHLILQQLLEIIPKLDSQNEQLVKELIGNDKTMQKFLSKHETYLISTCRNHNSEYMWEKYAGENGYKIVLDKKKLSLYIILKNGKKRADIFHCAEIIYDEAKQNEVLQKEYQDLINVKDSCLLIKDTIELILEHLMYVGNFYKKNEPKFTQEEEYRILINTSVHNNKNIDETLPLRKCNNSNKKHYVEIYFPPNAIKKIVCASEQAKNLIKKDITNIDIEIKNSSDEL